MDKLYETLQKTNKIDKPHARFTFKERKQDNNVVIKRQDIAYFIDIKRVIKQLYNSHANKI